MILRRWTVGVEAVKVSAAIDGHVWYSSERFWTRKNAEWHARRLAGALFSTGGGIWRPYVKDLKTGDLTPL